MWVCTHFLMIKATYSSVEAITTVLSGNGPSLARAHPFGLFFSRIIDFIILKRDHSISLKCVDGIAIWKLNFFSNQAIKQQCTSQIRYRTPMKNKKYQ